MANLIGKKYKIGDLPKTKKKEVKRPSWLERLILKIKK
jgi:hypothetical protein